MLDLLCQCQVCEYLGPEKDFRKNRTSRGGIRDLCLVCSRKDKQRRQKERAALIRKAKEKPCADCGGEFPYFVLDFDHRGNKDFQISGSYLRYGKERILEEIAKCDVVCANCHRFRTHRRLRKKQGTLRPLPYWAGRSRYPQLAGVCARCRPLVLDPTE